MSGACTGSSWSLKEGGGFTVVVPALPAVITYGATREEALENARDAIRLCLESLRARGLPAPQDGTLVEEVAITA
jgi:predicted RNase H-like HicB family nuclease